MLFFVSTHNVDYLKWRTTAGKQQYSGKSYIMTYEILLLVEGEDKNTKYPLDH